VEGDMVKGLKKLTKYLELCCLYCSTQQEEGHIVTLLHCYTVTETANSCHLSGLHS